MRAVLNDALRFVIARCLRVAGFACGALQRVRLSRYKAQQERLKRRYGLTVDSPLSSQAAEIARRVEMDTELRLRLIGHSVKRAIGTNAQYGSPDVLLPAAKK